MLVGNGRGGTQQVGAVAALLLAMGCRTRDAERAGGREDVVAIDGSSTVYPITEAVAEELRARNGARVTLGVSGTGGGFKKLCGGEVAIIGASRPIKPSEMVLCEGAGVEYIELPVAYDGIAVVAHRGASWVNSMKVDTLRRLWRPEAQGKVTRWRHLRAEWPDEEIHLFGPGVDSGTYDHFTKAVVGVEHSSRGDFTSSEDDNVLVQGVASNRYALGFFAFAYYARNENRLKVVAVDDGNDSNGKGPVAASFASVSDRTYQPLSRPIFIYVSKAAASRPQVDEFVRFYLQQGASVAREVGYVPLAAAAYGLALERFASRQVGSLFSSGAAAVGRRVEDLLAPN